MQVGDKWERADTLATNGIPMHFVTKYSLDKVDGNVATVKSSSIISFEGEMESIPGASAKLIGTSVGSFKVNTNTGIIISSSANVDMEIKLAVNGMDIPMKVSSKSTITSK